MMPSPRTSTMPTSKENLTVYLEPELKEKLAQWAKAEKRSMAFLAAEAIANAVSEWESTQESS
jgi:predicted transcriptional regulator